MSHFTTQDRYTSKVDSELSDDASNVDESLRAAARTQLDESGREPILYVAALLSVSAASIHALVVPEHFTEWGGYGVFFLAAAVLQTALALVLVRRPDRSMLAAGIVGNLAVVAVWAVSRSVGIPFFGPGAGEVEAVGLHDGISTASEIALVVLLFLVARSRDRSGALTNVES